MKDDRDPATTNFGKDSVLSSDDDLRQPQRLVPERASSTTIQDIPEELLVEILCRLPCAKSVFRCKSVSKSWLSLTSDPNFVGRFLWFQRHNQTLIPGTLINRLGFELLTADLCARFRSFKNKEIKKLEVLATWNDLVLCRRLDYQLVDGEYHICKRFCYHDDGQYYICNPRTMQLVSLPWIHQCGLGCDPVVGFMCEPYYKEEEEDDNRTDQKEEGEKKEVIRTDAEYKFKVVRILPPEDETICFEFKIQVFSNDIGEWRESLVSCPRGFIYSIFEHLRGATASNGMLYWNATDGDLLGLGPLMINNKSTPTCSNSVTANADPAYKFHVIKLVDRQEYGGLCSSYHLQAHRGGLQLVQTVVNGYSTGPELFVWELEKEEVEQTVVQGGGEPGQNSETSENL